MATNTTVDVSKVPGAVLVPFYSMFPILTNGNGIENQSQYMKNEVDKANTAAVNAFNFNVGNWTNDALGARDVLHTPIPPQPPIPTLQVFLRQDLPGNTGAWLAIIDGGPAGVYPPLPAPVVKTGQSGMVGAAAAGTPVQATQDAKLDDI